MEVFFENETIANIGQNAYRRSVCQVCLPDSARSGPSLCGLFVAGLCFKSEPVGICCGLAGIDHEHHYQIGPFGGICRGGVLCCHVISGSAFELLEFMGGIFGLVSACSIKRIGVFVRPNPFSSFIFALSCAWRCRIYDLQRPADSHQHLAHHRHVGSVCIMELGVFRVVAS